ncbi:MAG: amino acid adenylation domain-containing protein [Alphaproteobacteria bacterium]|nr:amino acid adenylation domain-containing protein [Alphaproteobacteria bacterium]
MNHNLALALYRNALVNPRRLAISAGGSELSYFELAALAQRIAAWLPRGADGRVGRVGILASRSLEACAGVLGTCWAGGTYVPISLKLPEERVRDVLERAGLVALIVDDGGTRLLSADVLSAAPRHVLVPDRERLPPRLHAVRGAVADFAALEAAAGLTEPEPVGADHIAYIEFTSGTTGAPKGVMIPAGAVCHYLSVMQQRYGFTAEDRIAETADLCFDVSVSNMFTSWAVGASLHVVPATQAMAPAKFIQQHALTVWFSVPSLIAMLQQMRLLPIGAFPTLRHSMFVGEPLPTCSALAWRAAAPNSIVDNLYGPTEATVVCLGQRVGDPPAVTVERDIVAIGRPFPGTEAAIVGPTREFLSPGAVGEVALAGAQLAVGYLDAPELTAARFPTIAGKRWYLTGDLGRQDSAGVFHHLGRLDNQVKVLGNRVELEEIDTHLQAVCRSALAVAVAWPVSHGAASGIVGFVAGTELDPAAIKEALRHRLPTYMVPTAVYRIRTMPMTPSGKVDRKALAATLEREHELRSA